MEISLFNDLTALFDNNSVRVFNSFGNFTKYISFSETRIQQNKNE